MGASDAASRLRSIVGLQKEARGELPPSLTLLPKFQQDALRAGQPPLTSGPHTSMLNKRAWKIWLQINLLAVVLYFALIGAPKQVDMFPQPIMPLTQDELLELLKMFDGTAAGGTTVFAHGGSAWKDREFFDMNRDQLLTRILRSQPGPTDDYQYFTQTMRSELSLEMYKKVRTACTNFTFQPPTEQEFFTYKWYSATAAWERYSPDGRNSYCQADGRTDQNTKRRSEKLHAQYFPGVGLESCAPPDLHNRPKDSHWLTVRVGPMRSFGNHDWHSLLAYDVAPQLTALLEEHKVLWLTGVFLAPVLYDPEDAREVQPLANPPLETGTVELSSTAFAAFPNRNPFMALYHDSNAFKPGDFSGRDKALHGKGFLIEDVRPAVQRVQKHTAHLTHFARMLPPDHGIPIYNPIQLQASLNDVRKPGSDEKTWTLEMGLRYTVEKPKKQVGMFTLASPGQILSTDNLKHWSEELVYWIPPDRTSVTWFTGTLKHAGKLVHGQAHANQRWFESMYLFSGSPESLGLNKGQFQVDYTTGRLFMPEQHGLTLDDFKLILFYNAAKSGNATLRCMAKFNLEPLLVSHVEEQSEGLNPNAPPYDRLPQTDCFGEWNFRAGHQWTIVAFNAPACYAACAGLRGPGDGSKGVPQRNLFTGAFAVDSKDAVNMKDIFSPGPVLDHYQTWGAAKPEHAFTVTGELSKSSKSMMDELQVATLLSGCFPPRPLHSKVATHVRGNLHTALESLRHNQLLDDVCVA